MTFMEEIALRQSLRFGLLIFGLIVALIYAGFFCYRGQSWSKTVIKALPMPAFAAAVWVSFGAPMVVGALILSAVGDISLSRTGDRAFKLGLVSFALAHVAYIIHFLTLSGGLLSAHWLALVVLALFALSSELWLNRHVGALKWPVRAYVLLIALMCAAALGLPGLPLVVIGALAFLASDTLLGLQQFRLSQGDRLQVPVSVLLWLLYVAGQFAILAGAGWSTPLFQIW